MPSTLDTSGVNWNSFTSAPATTSWADVLRDITHDVVSIFQPYGTVTPRPGVWSPYPYPQPGPVFADAPADMMPLLLIGALVLVVVLLNK